MSTKQFEPDELYQFPIIAAVIYRHSRAGGNPSLRDENWIPACAGMTVRLLIYWYGNRIKSNGQIACPKFPASRSRAPAIRGAVELVDLRP